MIDTIRDDEQEELEPRVIFLAFANARIDGKPYLDLPDEQRTIRESFAALERCGDWKIVERANATLDDIVKVFQDASYRDRIAIFHYGGHADGAHLLLENAGGDAGALVVGAGLSAFLSTQRGLKLVVLNGCATQAHAQHLLDAGVPTVIATSSEIGDAVAKQFAAGLYRSLTGGAKLEDAFKESTQAILADSALSRDIGRRVRDLTVGGMTAAQAQRSLWAIYAAEPATWTLGDIVHDPYLGLPDLPPRVEKRKVEGGSGEDAEGPYRYLKSFGEDDAHFFFGRGWQVRRLYYYLIANDSPRCHLLFGQSGVGKSSLLAAGLLPRLRASKHDVVYSPRDPKLGLSATLSRALAAHTPRNSEETGKSKVDQPVIIVLDQIERAFTQPRPEGGRSELIALCEELRKLFDEPSPQTISKVVLAFRKDWLAEVEEGLKGYFAPKAHFLERLGRAGIIEVVRAPKHFPEAFRADVEDGLAEIIAGDLLEDRSSQIAPVLQILLTRMWQEAKKTSRSRPQFDKHTYQTLKAQGALLDTFVTEQLKAAEERSKDIVGSGLLLDVLYSHVTDLGSAKEVSAADFAHDYGGRDIDPNAVRQLALDVYLLVDSPGEMSAAKGQPSSTRLAHDILGPLIRREFDRSERRGQLARRALELRTRGGAGLRQRDILGPRDLRRVIKGAGGMRRWNDAERQLIAASRRGLLQSRGLRAAGIVILLATGTIAWTLFSTDRERQANEMASAAEANLAAGSDPLQSDSQAVEAMQRLVAMKKSTLTAERAIRSALAVIVPNASVIELAKSAPTIAIAGPATIVAVADSHGVHVANLGSRDTTTLPWQNAHLLAVSDNGSVIAAADDKQTLAIWNVADEKPLLIRSLAQSIQAMAWSEATRSVAVLKAGSRAVDLWRPNDTIPWRALAHPDTVKDFAINRSGDRIVTIAESTFTLWHIDRAGAMPHRLPAPFVTDALFSASGQCVLFSSLPAGMAWAWNSDADTMSPPDSVGSQLKAVAIDSTCQTAALGTTDGTIAVFDAQSGTRIWSAKLSRGIASLAFSSDGRLASASGDQMARVWGRDGKEQARMAEHEGVLGARFANDSTIVTVSASGNLRTWLLRSTASVWQKDVGDLVTGLAVTGTSDSTAWVAALNSRGVVRVWRPDSANSARTFALSGTRAITLLPPTGTAIAGGIEGLVRISRTSIEPSMLGGQPVRALGASRVGRLAVANIDGSIEVTDTAGKHVIQLGKAAGRQPTAVALSGTGTFVVLSMKGGAVRAWQLPDTQPRVDTTYTSAVNAVAVDNSERLFAIAAEDGRLIVRSVHNERKPMELHHESAVISIAFSADGNHVATGTRSGLARVWDLRTEREVSRIPHPAAVAAVGFSPSGRYVATGSASGIVSLWMWQPEDLIRTACAAVNARPKGEGARVAPSKAPPSCQPR